MFRRLGEFLSQWWIAVLVVWFAIFLGVRIGAPDFNDVAKEGEFVFLPETMPSRQAEIAYETAFPERRTTSNVVVVITRDQAGGLTDADRDFIDEQLKPALEKIRDQVNTSAKENPPAAQKATASTQSDVVSEIHTFSDRGIGELLVSRDNIASLVTIDLNLDFQDTRNWNVLDQIEGSLKTLENSNEFPKGLKLALTGSATLGRDLSQAEAYSARHTGPLTITLVIILLVVIYRAPLLAIIPLLTLFMAVDVSLHGLVRLAELGYVPIFKGLQEYATVISYGPGIDYCLFLIARYKENLEEGADSKKALSAAIAQVGSAITASALTVICGIGMLTFAQFGKFHQAGIGISLTLIVTLFATLTLTPALLFMCGHWVFWPKPGYRPNEHGERLIPSGHDVAVQSDMFTPMWTAMGKLIERYPLPILLGTLGCMVPFIAFGIATYKDVNYGLLESLPKGSPSAAGAKLLEKHFPAGITGPVQVVLQNKEIDFGDEDGISKMKVLSDALMQRKEELKIADIRSVATPLGMNLASDDDTEEESFIAKAAERSATRRRAVDRYVTSNEELKGGVTEMEIILQTNPFSMESVATLTAIDAAVQQELSHDAKTKTKISTLGPTASVRDVSEISKSDQKTIYVLVVACVTLILMVLLRGFITPIYLMVTVLLSYLTTLAVTWLVFYALDPTGFIGLDWTVPLFLFVVLIAVGEDYNIFLVSRIHEEQQRTDPVDGITIGLACTGGIITSCGLIMAGTFASLLIGTLARMQQLGFALAFGVLLDTFVVRPILVPAFLMLFTDRSAKRELKFPASAPASGQIGETASIAPQRV